MNDSINAPFAHAMIQRLRELHPTPTILNPAHI
jgi:hypothetical protein